jgi:hypothetical protein
MSRNGVSASGEHGANSRDNGFITVTSQSVDPVNAADAARNAVTLSDGSYLLRFPKVSKTHYQLRLRVRSYTSMRLHGFP